MKLEIFLPSQVFTSTVGVSRIVVETTDGSYGFWPHRRDCVASLVAGVLLYETPEAGVTYVAVDEGVLVKTGPHVRVSVRQAIAGTDLAQLHEAVSRRFRAREEREREVRAATTRMEGALVRRLTELQHGR